MSALLAQFQFAPYYDVAVASRRGCGPVQRAENQDNFVVIDFAGQACCLLEQRVRRTQLAGWPAGHGRVAVLDGMGGHGHGREAAEAVAEGLLALPPCRTVAELAGQLDLLHARLQRHFATAALATGARPGTTLTLLELPPGAAPLLYHVGDSRLYEIGPQQARPLTVDHVPATAAAMAGQIDEHGWRQRVHGSHSPHIAQAFILGNTFSNPAQLSDPLLGLTPLNLPTWLGELADRRVLTLRAGAAYLLATDGFWSCAAPERFVAGWPALLANAPDAGAMVTRLFDALDRAPPAGLQADNLTALVLRPLLFRHCEGEETALPHDGRD
ncbi:PP2C family serine/threonine-protein phosphatase [Massilia sp. H6]|uniref:PP2C family protein-serine/threonine phosphatase n=1 Tax=Massilia sp. H6 TaxID=2970464 RepID=UPI002168D05A|nr:protein phosphatase 2C domain-containing protein [Massilia sp. H6]UVW26905.1 protein phosphatase 2C domain-containing protein [Massilia sp. H6]